MVKFLLRFCIENQLLIHKLKPSMFSLCTKSYLSKGHSVLAANHASLWDIHLAKRVSIFLNPKTISLFSLGMLCSLRINFPLLRVRTVPSKNLHQKLIHKLTLEKISLGLPFHLQQVQIIQREPQLRPQPSRKFN